MSKEKVCLVVDAELATALLHQYPKKVAVANITQEYLVAELKSNADNGAFNNVDSADQVSEKQYRKAANAIIDTESVWEQFLPAIQNIADKFLFPAKK